jgi:hypothetical protein
MKNIFTEEAAYLKDNPEGYWFKRKLYGWGWTPARWQGWATLAVFVVLIIVDFMRISATQPTESDTLKQFVPQLFLFLLVLIGICYKKGESPRWQWGRTSERGE